MSTLRMRRVLAAAAVAAAASGGLLVGTVPAFADAQGCSGNTCMYLGGHTGSAAVQGWAYSYDFSGYFHLTGPNGVSQYSPNQVWRGHKGNAWSTTVGTRPPGTTASPVCPTRPAIWGRPAST